LVILTVANGAAHIARVLFGIIAALAIIGIDGVLTAVTVIQR
jgi:hypothetical protein